MHSYIKTYSKYYSNIITIHEHIPNRRCPCGVMVKAMDCGIVISEFKLQSCYYVPDKYTWERYEPPYPPSYGLNSTITVLLEGWHWHLITYKVDRSLSKETKPYTKQLKYAQCSINEQCIKIAFKIRESLTCLWWFSFQQQREI